MIDAARIATGSMTPVIVLSDAFLANAVTEWTAPDIGALQANGSAAKNGASDPADGEPDAWLRRDADSLARPWTPPGTPERMHRTGGLEKDAHTGDISYDPSNHRDMVALRAEKTARIKTVETPQFTLEGCQEGDLLAIGWGSTYGPIRRAVSRLNDAGHAVGHLHIRQLWPLPDGIEDILARYRNVACAELNSGQLAAILRSAFLVPVRPITQISGRPFLVGELESLFQDCLGEPVK
jgi:2-oxoglutarate ferredoxin oxidoreductase subunit alpha